MLVAGKVQSLTFRLTRQLSTTSASKEVTIDWSKVFKYSMPETKAAIQAARHENENLQIQLSELKEQLIKYEDLKWLEKYKNAGDDVKKEVVKSIQTFQPPSDLQSATKIQALNEECRQAVSVN